MSQAVETTTRPWNGVAVPTPGTFAIDPAHSRAGFVARHLMVSKVRGAFTAVSGTVTVAEDPAASHVAADIDAASIDTGVADRDAHLRSADFLDVETYPHLRFRSTGLRPTGDGEFVLTGELSIRDVTRAVALAVEFEGVARSPWGQEVIGFTATTEIDREEFGITWNQALETGGVLVGKQVKIEISVEAIRQ
ncbi:polyisoprenoid-binding protein [Pilimelia terevasa]|uniref:Polyisoprenoid-binding protein n=1 Tax=Pilimelia terevasa TaxID=53372 RepID=A0A8J3BTM0_9ACTN|nr:YceI family protein [Pilimelia terevasa]GGK34896.1 polyisoprenoid-binding protein [Pilimelia terevasa]